MKPRNLAHRVLHKSLLCGLLLMPLSGCSGQAETPRPVRAIKQPIFVLGDSFAGMPDFQSNLRILLPEFDLQFDAVGGSSLEDQLVRYSSNPAVWRMPLIVVDGGQADPKDMEFLQQIIDRQDKACGVWFYMEPVPRYFPDGRKVAPRSAAVTERVAMIQQQFPEHFIPTVKMLSESGDDSPTDRQAASVGEIPLSLRKDNMHLNMRGNQLLTTVIAEAVAKADIPTDRCIPDVRGKNR